MHITWVSRIRNITVENCTLGAPAGVGHYGPNCDAGINIKTERGNGGWIEDVRRDTSTTDHVFIGVHTATSMTVLDACC